MENQDITRRLDETREAAKVLAEDLSYARRLLSSVDMSPDDLRRLSSVTRRLLTDKGGDLVRVSGPRIEKLRLTTQDVSQIFYPVNMIEPSFIFLGEGKIYNKHIGSFSIIMQDKLVLVGPVTNARSLYNISKNIDVSIDGFLAQKVISHYGRTVSRKQVVDYVANVASGVHTGLAKTDSDSLLTSIRHCVSYENLPKNPEFAVHVDLKYLFHKEFGGDGSDLHMFRQHVDIALASLATTMHYILESASVNRLIDIIDKE